jgi:glycosyltransferase involved in cell wall biosynthesis
VFSIIIPTYNRALKLERCLDSLVAQTFKNFEVIVCDDGSKDNTLDIINKFEKLLDIKYFWNDNFGGPAKPRNVGIKNSKYDWICFLDSDDWWTPHKLEITLLYLDYNDFIYHDLIKMNQSNINCGIVKGWSIKNNPFVYLLTYGNAIPTSSVVINKKIIDCIGFFSEEKKHIAVEDFDYFIRASRITNKFKYIDQKLGYYFIGDNISTNVNQILKEKDLFDYYSTLLSNNDKVLATSNQLFKNARSYHDLSMFVEAKMHYLKAIKSSNYKIKIKSLIGLVFSLLKFKI